MCRSVGAWSDVPLLLMSQECNIIFSGSLMFLIHYAKRENDAHWSKTKMDV